MALTQTQLDERESSLGARLSTVAAAHPDAVAVESSTGRLTYAQLDGRSDALAAALIDQLGPGQDPIGLLLADVADFATALCGVLKAGKIGLPLMANQPETARAAVIADARAPAVLTETAGAPIGTAERIPVDTAAPAGRAASLPVVDPGDPALLLYTSGSSGEPKGVVRSHRCELHQFLTIQGLVGAGPGRRFGLTVPTAFAAAYFSVFGALLAGGTLLQYDTPAAGLPGLPEWLSANDVHVMAMLASMASPLAAAAGPAGLPTLAHAVAGGERLSGATARCVIDLVPNGQALQVYASTEAAVVAISPLGDVEAVQDAEPVPLGAPVPGTAVAVTEDGEIVVTGRYLADGYWNRPGDTAAAFSSDASGVRSFRTGDHGVIDSSGSLTVLGREDRRVKIRGHRVELLPIEQALLAIDGIAEAVVITRAERSGRDRLVGFVVPDPGSEVPAEAELRRLLGRDLAPHAVPAVIHVIDRFPTLPNGKRDLRSLRERRQPAGVKAPTPPRTETERRLVAIWSELLDVERIGVDDGFFALGGDSLDVAEVIAAIEQEFGWRPSVGSFAGEPTIAALAELLERRPSRSILGPATPGAVESRGPRLYFVSGLAGQALAGMRLGGALLPELGLYSFEMPGTYGEGHPQDVPRLARGLVTALRELQPAGPYWLAGFSFGAMVVAEMAAQLERSGAEVAGVILLDGMSGQSRAQRAPRFHRGTTAPLLELADRVIWGLDRLGRRPIRASRRVAYIWHHNRRAALRHTPRPFAAPVLVARCTRRRDPDPLLGWRRYAQGPAMAVEIDATHDTLLLEPAVHEVAAHIRRFVQTETAAAA